MIIKSISHKRKTSFKYLLEYLMSDDHNAEIIHKQLLRGDTLQMWQKQFINNSKKRKINRKNAVYLHHEILSFSPESSPYINKEKLIDISKMYIKQRAKRTLALVVFHQEKDHFHVHLVIASTDFMGQSNRLSKQEFAQLKLDMQDFQKQNYPELNHSLVQHEKDKRTRIKESERRRSIRTDVVSDKETLYYTIQSIFHASPNIESFIHTLKHNDIKPYLRRGKLTGVHFGNRKFRFKTLGITDDMLLEKNNQIIKMKTQTLNR